MGGIFQRKGLEKAMHDKKYPVALSMVAISPYGCVFVASCIARQTVSLEVFAGAASVWLVFLAVGAFFSWWQLLVVDALLMLFTKINRAVLLALNYI